MRVAVITGGMGGLGDSISTKMHAAGYRVVVTHSPTNTKAKEWLSEHKTSGQPGTSRYITTKNKKNTPERLELKKYNPILKKVTVHKEIK